MTTNLPSRTGNISLILCLSAALQSWGTVNGAAARTTEPEPTFSGIVGLIANAQGRDRTDPIDDLADLTLRTRTDIPGDLVRDYHTSGGGLINGEPYGVAQTKHVSPGKESAVLSERFYLGGATFLAILTGNPTIVNAAATALTNPARYLYLGRKACAPDRPLVHGLSDGDPDTLLRTTPWLANPTHQRITYQTPGPHTLNATTPGDPADPFTETRWDVPVTFDSLHRTYKTRTISRLTIPIPTTHGTSHKDPS